VWLFWSSRDEGLAWNVNNCDVHRLGLLIMMQVEDDELKIG